MMEMTLLIAQACPHCASVLQSAQILIKEGRISRLTVINLSVDQNAAQEYAVRSVPWLKIGPYELSGAYSLSELKQWIDKAAARDDADYFQSLFEEQKLEQAIHYLKSHPDRIHSLLKLMNADHLSLSVQLGISALMEELAGDPLFEYWVPAIGQALQTSQKNNIRADLAHFLGLSRHPKARAWLEPLLNDANPEVREIAAESLAQI